MVAKKEMDLLQASVVQTGQLVQNLPKVNGNGAKWKQLADRACLLQVSYREGIVLVVYFHFPSSFICGVVSQLVLTFSVIVRPRREVPPYPPQAFILPLPAYFTIFFSSCLVILFT
jgi:hypothetical protein